MATDDKLDDLDRAIVSAMSNNGRMSPAEIAERVGDVTERTIRNRLKTLIEKRLIYMATIPDPRAMGDSLHAELRMELDPKLAMAAADQIVDHPMIDWVGFRGSDVDLTAALLASSTEKVADVVEEISQIDGVRSIKVITFLTVLKSYGFRLQAADEMRAKLNRNQQKTSLAAE
ncbi:Lrp/AsnC family transcriptional regulator [Octadecabacter sp.]|nr:Lrp/AsnC family transcriptional regulator [Octadecabacter sp.]